MDEVQETILSTDNSSKRVEGRPNLIADVLRKMSTRFPKNIQDCVEQFHSKPLKSNDYLKTSEFPTRGNKESSTTELSLERQMDAWKLNPAWVDHPPDIKVTIPKGLLSKLRVKVDVGLPPDAVYNIVTDPDNKRVFKNIKEVISRKVLVDEGPRQVVEVEQAAIWRFLWWSGTISVHVLVDQNREDHTMKFKQIKSGFMEKFEGFWKFKQIKSGFMEKFEGFWKVEPLLIDEELCGRLKPKSISEYVSCSKGRGRIASKVSLEQLIQPAIVPPRRFHGTSEGSPRRRLRC